MALALDPAIDLPPGQLNLMGLYGRRAWLEVVEVKSSPFRPSTLTARANAMRELALLPSGSRTAARRVLAVIYGAAPWLDLDLRWHYLIAVLHREVRMDP